MSDMKMNQDRTMEYFFEIHNELPREGPGDRESTGKAFSMIVDLPDNSSILDVGCGPGMQTLDLLNLVSGNITAVDNHQPFLDQLAHSAKKIGVADKIGILNMDMGSMDFKPPSFDLIWSEGAAYSIGFENALTSWKQFLKPGGYLAASELAWIRSQPPQDWQQRQQAWYPAPHPV